MDKSKNCAETPGGTHGEELAGALPPVVAGEAAAGALPAADAGAAREAGVLETDPLSPAHAWGGVTAGPDRVADGGMLRGPHVGPAPSVWGGLDAGADRGLDLNRGAPQAKEVGTEPNGRVSEAAPIKNSCGVEQPEARQAHNLEVAGSSPAAATSTSIVAIDAPPGAADAGPDTAQSVDPSSFSPTRQHAVDISGDAARQAADPLPDWPWPCSPQVAPAPRGLFPHQRFGS